MLFSEPKIPQFAVDQQHHAGLRVFQCSSASRKFLNTKRFAVGRCELDGFSALQRAENSSILQSAAVAVAGAGVSVLFSEPKIPQCADRGIALAFFASFSALQRAENSSMRPSSSRRLLCRCFSALQRAENSSIGALAAATVIILTCFSALQRAENSSIWPGTMMPACGPRFSALQRAENSSMGRGATRYVSTGRRFSALQRAENSSMRGGAALQGAAASFQCSSASRKFLNRVKCPTRPVDVKVSVLFSEPKIPQ